MSAIDAHMAEHVMRETTVFTDEHPSHKKVGEKGYVHFRVKHSAKVYVDGNVIPRPSKGSGRC